MRPRRISWPGSFLERAVGARLSTLRCILTAFLLLVLAVSFASAQMGRARLEGTLTVESGDLEETLTLVFQPGENTNTRPQEMEVSKSGRISNPFMPSGTYQPKLKGGQYFLKSMHFLCRNPNGRVIGEFETGAHPEKGLPEVTLPSGMRCEIDLVAASAAEKQAYQRQLSLAEARGPLKEISQLYESGQFQEAIAEAEALIEDKPELGPAYYMKGVALRELGRFAEAIEAIESAIDLGTEQPGIEGVLASTLLQRAQKLKSQGKGDEAKQAFSRAADLYGEAIRKTGASAPLLQNRAAALDEAGREKQAVPVIEKLLELDPDNVAARLHLAGLYQKQGKDDKALRILDKLPQGSEAAAKSVYNVASELYNDKRYEQALMAANKAAEIAEGLTLVHHLKGYIYMAMGRQKDAMRELRTFLELEPDHPKAQQDRQLLEALEKQAESQ